MSNCSSTKEYYRSHSSLINMYPAFGWSDDLDDTIQSYDNMLHQSLEKIVRERCFSSNVQIEEYKSILEKEPILSKCFSKNELKKFSLLWISVMAGYQNTTELLIRSGVDINERFGRRCPQLIDEKWTILHLLLDMVSSLENERLIGLIMDRGIDFQSRDCNGRTLLHYALVNKQLTEMLLEKGADVNVADNRGVTPLLLAATMNCAADELLPLLIKNGANIFAKSHHGWNALHYLTMAPNSRHSELARILIEKGVSLHDRAQNGLQPIHLAIDCGSDELVKIFLDNGADVNVQLSGVRLLYYAARNFFTARSKQIVEILLERGADVHQRTYRDHYTPLHGICLESAHCTRMEIRVNFVPAVTGIIELLLCAGADVLAEDSVGKTPLAYISADCGERFMQSVGVPGMKEIIKALALRKVFHPMNRLKDEMIIRWYPAMLSYYGKCIEEIYNMKSARFFGTCTLFDLLAKNEYHIAKLMKNCEFESKFRLCSLGEFGEFSVYAGYINQAFRRAEGCFHSMLEQEDVINEAFFYTLPYLVVRNIVSCIFDDRYCRKNVK